MPLANRRTALKTALLGSAATLSATWSGSALADRCAVFTPERQATVSPDEALKRLQEGNARFVAGQAVNCDLLQQVRDSAEGQAPFAAVIGCVDSRVPPELVFDQRIGDIFVARLAGNVVSDEVLGSVEFATKLAGAKLIVVLGHTNCGAIKGAVDNVQLGHLTGLLAQIRPVLTKMQYKGVPSSKDKELVQRVAERHVQDGVQRLQHSPVLSELQSAGKLKIVGGMHDLKTGKISWQT